MFLFELLNFRFSPPSVFQGPAVQFSFRRPKASALAWNALTDAASSAAATWAEERFHHQFTLDVRAPSGDIMIGYNWVTPSKFSIGNTCSNCGFSIVMLFFWVVNGYTNWVKEATYKYRGINWGNPNH